MSIGAILTSCFSLADGSGNTKYILTRAAHVTGGSRARIGKIEAKMNHSPQWSAGSAKNIWSDKSRASFDPIEARFDDVEGPLTRAKSDERSKKKPPDRPAGFFRDLCHFAS